MSDAVGDRHGRPDAAAAVIGGDRGVERLQRLRTVEARMAAETQRAEPVLAGDADGRQHVLDRPFPEQDLAITQVGAVLQRDAVHERLKKGQIRPGKSGHGCISCLVCEFDRIAWCRRYRGAGRRSRITWDLGRFSAIIRPRSVESRASTRPRMRRRHCGVALSPAPGPSSGCEMRARRDGAPCASRPRLSRLS